MSIDFSHWMPTVRVLNAHKRRRYYINVCIGCLIYKAMTFNVCGSDMKPRQRVSLCHTHHNLPWTQKLSIMNLNDIEGVGSTR